MRPRRSLVIDRLAHWYYVPREWIKKVALMDEVYLLNNPFTFQTMEKHGLLRVCSSASRCRTWLIPVQGAAGRRALRLHRGPLQPALRPRADRRPHRLPAT